MSISTSLGEDEGSMHERWSDAACETMHPYERGERKRRRPLTCEEFEDGRNWDGRSQWDGRMAEDVLLDAGELRPPAPGQTAFEQYMNMF